MIGRAQAHRVTFVKKSDTTERGSAEISKTSCSGPMNGLSPTQHVTQVGGGPQPAPRHSRRLSDTLDHANLSSRTDALRFGPPFGFDVDQATTDRTHEVLAVFERRSPAAAFELTTIERLARSSPHFRATCALRRRSWRGTRGETNDHASMVTENTCEQPEPKPCEFLAANVWNRLWRTPDSCGRLWTPET